MPEAELVPSPSNSETSMALPPYHRSHLRSNTYHTLLHIFSHLSASNTDNGGGGTGQERHEKRPECPEVIGSGFMDPKDSIPQKEIPEVHETIEGGEDRGGEFGANRVVLSGIELMMGTEEVDDSIFRSQTERQRQLDAMTTQGIDCNIEKRMMDELELVLKGTEELVGNGGLMPLDSGLGEEQNGNSEVELMDYQVEHVDFQHSDVKKSNNAGKLQVQGELDQQASQGFHLSTNKQIAVVGSLPNTEEGEFEKEEPCRQKVTEPMHLSLDQDMSREALNVCEDGRFPNSAILEDKHEMHNEEEILEKGDVEEGEISGDFGMDVNLSDMSSADSLIVQEEKIDEVQKPKTVIENMILPSKTGGGEKEEGYSSNTFIVNALQDGQVEPGTFSKTGIAWGAEVEISGETIKWDKAGKCGLVLKPENSKDGQIRRQGISDLPKNLTQNQSLHSVSLKEDAANSHGTESAVKQHKVDVSGKKKRGPGSEAKKARQKRKKQKKRAEKNRQLGVKRLKLPPPIQKPKTIIYCRHYLSGRCHEGDKCHFSHDTVPLTKSKPCSHFARHSCMKGDDCPFDHQLSKYPCSNFVSKGSCSRGDACMFSHQIQAPTKQDIPTPSNVNRPELKSSLPSGNTNFSMPLNNHGCSSVKQNHFNSMGIHSPINAEPKVTETVQKQPKSAPKGISFINLSTSSLCSPNTPKQGMITPNKESLVPMGSYADRSASGTNQTSVEVHLPKKLPSVAHKGINFLSFGKGSICSFKSSISSLSNRQNGTKSSQSVNFGLPNQASSSLDKNDHRKVSNGTEQSVPQTDQEGIKASGNSQISTETSSTFLVSPFASHTSSEHLAPRYREYVSNSGQRALLSTLAFAAEHESDIKMKCPAPLWPEENKESK